MILLWVNPILAFVGHRKNKGYSIPKILLSSVLFIWVLLMSVIDMMDDFGSMFWLVNILLLGQVIFSIVDTIMNAKALATEEGGYTEETMFYGQQAGNTNATQAALNKGLKNPVDGCVYCIDGVRGKHIDVYENKCVIKTKVTLGSILTSNATDGEKTIYYKDCVGLQYKPSSFTIGYIQLETASAMMNNKGNNFFGENSFTFDQTVITNEKMEEVANYIRQKIDEIKTAGDKPATVVNAVSPAEELKKMKELLDMGIITQEEFDAKKKQLLGF
jgi:hypothetical protein